MCGIAGFLASGPGQDEALLARAATMAGAMVERGPDGEGVWCDGGAGIALAHRRLAILDLSPAGAQPMTSADGRWVVVFNGEIYNHGDLRRGLLRGEALRGTSDTEVMLELIAERGFSAALRELVGMFAIAAWDRTERTLHLARDRYGEKPLYWGRIAGSWVFASVLAPLARFPGFQAEVDPAAIAAFFSEGCIPAPLSVWRSLRKLPPGCRLELAAGATEAEPLPWWSPVEAEAQGRAAPFIGDEDQAAIALERLLERAVGEQLVADVPVGCFLSGGIDSSLVAAMARKVGGGPVCTFTMSFSEAGFDESPHAQAVADHLGTEHHRAPVTPADVIEVVPRMAEWYGEPFADSSQVPTSLLCRWARQRVTVALSGDGADELFGGYSRYSHCLRLQGALGRLPRWSRQALATLLRPLPQAAWSALLWPADRALGRRSLENLPSQRVAKLVRLLPGTDLASVYRGILARGESPLAPGLPQWNPLRPDSAGMEPLRWMLRQDQAGYLHDDILAKVDRAAMAWSLETRAPFLDHRIGAFAWSLPSSWLLSGGAGKRILRRILAKHVPPGLYERPKMGFAMPLDVWLSGALRPWAEDRLSARALQALPWLESRQVQRLWRRFLAGEHQLRYRIWDVLMLSSWADSAPGRR